MVMDQSGADPFHLIGADGCAYPAAADRDTPLHLFGSNCPSEGHNEVRIVVTRIEVVRAKVCDLMTGGSQLRNQFLLKLKASVIGGDTDFHAMPLCLLSSIVFGFRRRLNALKVFQAIQCGAK